MASHDPITGQPFLFGSSTSGITDITTDETLLGKGTPEEPLKVTNPEKDLFLEVDNIQQNESITSRINNNPRHIELDFSAFDMFTDRALGTPQVYQTSSDHYYFIPKHPTLVCSLNLNFFCNVGEIDKLIIATDFSKVLDQTGMRYIEKRYIKQHHYNNNHSTMFYVQRNYKDTTRLHNLLGYRDKDVRDINDNGDVDLSFERLIRKHDESSTFLEEMHAPNFAEFKWGYVMGTNYTQFNFTGGAIGYNSFSVNNKKTGQFGIYDSIFGIPYYLVESMWIEGNAANRNTTLNIKFIAMPQGFPISDIKRYTSSGIHIYLP